MVQSHLGRWGYAYVVRGICRLIQTRDDVAVRFISVPQVSLAALDDPARVDPTFLADVAGSYVLQLIVNDGELA